MSQTFAIASSTTLPPPLLSAQTRLDPLGLPKPSQTVFANSDFMGDDSPYDQDEIFAPRLFAPLDIGAPNLPSRNTHPIGKDKVTQQRTAAQTNKFYSNFFLGNQTQGVWSFPYTLSWPKGSGNSKSFGLAVTHLERSMYSFGPIKQPANAPQFYINPLGNVSFLLMC